MSIISRHPAGGDSAAGKLAATLLSVTVAGMAEPARFRRGKAYVIDDAVVRVEVLPGVLRADVRGSRPDPYVATVRVDAATRPADLAGDRLERHHVSALCPEAEAMQVSCTCPDDDVPCKHAIAALLVLAQELVTRPQLLVEWRCGTAATPRPPAGARASTGRHLRVVAGGGRPQPDNYEGEQWHVFFGQSVEMPDPAALVAALPPMRPAAAEAGGVDIGALLRSAQARVRAHAD